MNFISWFRLFLLEQRLNFGAFGKYDRYRCWCLERNGKTVAEKLHIAREVIDGPGVSLAESQHNVEFIRKHSVVGGKANGRPAKDASPMNRNPELHGTGS
ncbi:MAG TPA: hypothetical protein VK395_29225 [Gemmataceae bacterium]|nr:hypothetical protein [Gemmataceae bacterium]